MIDEALLEAVRAAPDDDAPRLVLADRLQERGETWGELISVQCALAREELEVAARVRLMRREHELLSTRDWWDFDGTGYEVTQFLRGFPSRIRAEGVSGVSLLMQTMPWLPDVEDIVLPVRRSDGILFERLARLPTRGLTIDSETKAGLVTRDAQVIEGWLAVTGHRLRRIGFQGRTQRSAIFNLVSAVASDELEALTFREVQTRISLAWFDVPALRRLTVSGVSFDGFLPEVSDKLEAVELSNMMLERRAADLVRSLKSVRHLDFASTGLDDEALRLVLQRAPSCLESLGVAHGRFGPDSFERLSMLDVGHLDISSTGLTPADARVLIRSSTLPATLVLTLSKVEAGDAIDALRERFAVVKAS